MSTAHANSPRDLLSRLETMALMSDVDLPVSHVREQIAGALDLVVHMARLPDGRRCVARISAVEGLRSGALTVEDVFVWRRRPTPGFAATGTMPSLLRLLDERDERIDPRIFSPARSDHGASPGAMDRPARPPMHTASPLQVEPTMWEPGSPARGEPAPLHWPGRLRRLGTIVE